ERTPGSDVATTETRKAAPDAAAARLRTWRYLRRARARGSPGNGGDPGRALGPGGLDPRYADGRLHRLMERSSARSEPDRSGHRPGLARPNRARNGGAMTEFVPALREDELWAGEMRALSLAGQRVLLLRLEDRG